MQTHLESESKIKWTHHSTFLSNRTEISYWCVCDLVDKKYCTEEASCIIRRHIWNPWGTTAIMGVQLSMGAVLTMCIISITAGKWRYGATCFVPQLAWQWWLVAHIHQLCPQTHQPWKADTDSWVEEWILAMLLLLLSTWTRKNCLFWLIFAFVCICCLWHRFLFPAVGMFHLCGHVALRILCAFAVTVAFVATVCVSLFLHCLSPTLLHCLGRKL